MDAVKLKLTEYVESENSSIVIRRKSGCDEFSIDTCITYFEEYKQTHEVNGDFEDDIWEIKEVSTDLFCKFNFCNMPVAYKDKLKKYTILRLHKQNLSPRYMYFSIQYIYQTMFRTNFFDEEYLEDFKLETILHKTGSAYLFPLCQFLIFIDEGQPYVKFLNSITFSNPRNRDIPGFESIILFDKIVDNVIKHHKELYQRHYFILLWWKVSTIIPMRPIEFVKLKRNCIYQKHNEYYIHIDRKKNKSNRKIYTEPIMTEFIITEEVYNFFKTFVDYANNIDNNEFLISRNVYITTLKRNKDTKHKVNSRDFEKMLIRFLDEVVKDIYGFEIVPLNQRENDNQIEKIRLGDTRHLAIINLMMQGINPLEIMRLAGHHNVETQMGYYSHVEKFMTSKTYVLSRLLKNNSTISNDFTMDNGAKKIEKDLLGPSYYQLPLVANGSGRCKCSNFPQDCESTECIFCKHFLPENMNTDYMTILEEQNKKEIELKKETLQYVLKHHMCVPSNEVERASKDYIFSLNQNLFIQSYKLKKEEIYEE